MAGLWQSISHAARKFWTGLTGPNAPAVVLHDPAAQRPRDLDDPFFDDKAQKRMANVISHASQKK
jgi:hypothetical protein